MPTTSQQYIVTPSTDQKEVDAEFETTLEFYEIGENNRADQKEPHLPNVWPEGHHAKMMMQEWCQNEGIPGPNEELEGRPKTQAKCSFGLVNKLIPAGSEMWKSQDAKNAIQVEKEKHEKRGTWDVEKVIELRKLEKNMKETGEEVILGGVHPVMYQKHSESPKDAVLRDRIVFTAPRAKTNSGFDPHTIYNEISSAPVTFQAARASRAVGALRGFVSSTRDAESAYLQAGLERKGSLKTYVSLPQTFWPESWKGKYSQSIVPLELALFGHPEAGNILENFSFEELRKLGWEDAPEFPSVFKHKKTKAMLTGYVDDFDMQASQKDSEKLWEDIAKAIDFKDPPRYWSNEPTPHLGCVYRTTQTKTKDGHILTTTDSEMKSYLLNLVEKFEKQWDVKVKMCKTPYLDPTEERKLLAKEAESKPKYGKEAASPIMAGLYAARSTRPDLNVSTLRQARRVTRWTAVDDAKLLRYLGYIKGTAGVGLRSQLSTSDLATAVLRIWPDADLAGDPNEDTHSSGGSWIELASADGARTYPLHWSYSKQGFTAGHTQEAEVAAMFDTIRSDGLPLASLLEFFLEREIIVEVLEDNEAAIAAL